MEKFIKGRKPTFSADASSEIVAELEWVLDGDTRRDPHFLKFGEVLLLLDGHDQPLVVPGPGEEVEEADPEVAHIPPVLAPAGPGVDHLPVGAEPGVPSVHQVLRLVGASVELLEDWQHRRRHFL